MGEKFSNKDHRCLTFRDTFLGTSGFDRQQYAGLGCDIGKVSGQVTIDN